MHLGKTGTFIVGGVMLLIYKEIPHKSLTELENDTELVWAKVFANKTPHYIESWNQNPVSRAKTFNSFEINVSTLSTIIRNFHRSTYWVTLILETLFGQTDLTKMGPC